MTVYSTVSLDKPFRNTNKFQPCSILLCYSVAANPYPSPIEHRITMASPTTGTNQRVTVSLPDLFKSFLVVKPELDSNYESVKDESEKWLQRWANGASVTVAYRVSDGYQHNGTLREAEQEGQLLRLHIHGLRHCSKCPAREAQDFR